MSEYSQAQHCLYLVGNGTDADGGAAIGGAEAELTWDQQVYANFSLWMNGIIMTIVILLGLFGNAATCYVLSMKLMRAKINQYIIALACWDSVVLATCWLLFSWGALLHGELPSHGNHVYNYMIFYPISNIAKTASIWTLLFTSTERYLAISRPLYHQRHYTPVRIRFVLVTIGITAGFFNLSKFFEIAVIYCPVQGGKRFVPAIITTSLRDNHSYFVVYHVILNLLFISLGPFCVQSILTALLSYHLRRSLKYRRRHSSFYGGNQKVTKKGRSLETSMTQMFVVVCLKFLICLLLPTGINIAELTLKLTNNEQLMINGAFTYFVDLSNLFAVTNSCLNFPIYMLFCCRFRRAFILCCIRRHALTNPAGSFSETIPLRDAIKNHRRSRNLSLPSIDQRPNSLELSTRDLRLYSVQLDVSEFDENDKSPIFSGGSDQKLSPSNGVT